MTPANIIIYITTRRYSEEEEAAGCLYDGSVPQSHPRQLNINPGKDTRQHGLSKAEKTPYITFNPLFFFPWVQSLTLPLQPLAPAPLLLFRASVGAGGESARERGTAMTYRAPPPFRRSVRASRYYETFDRLTLRRRPHVVRAAEPAREKLMQEFVKQPTTKNNRSC